AHPDVIDRIGTKEVLYRTRGMGWGCDTRFHATAATLRAELPASLRAGPSRVLKQIRGQSGDGVWQVALAEPRSREASGALLRVRHAKRGSPEELITLEAFVARCAPYFDAAGGMIDQEYQPRLTEGMIRCYLVRDRVAGFGEQLVNMLYPAPRGAAPSAAPLPGPRHYFPPTRPDFQRLKEKLERHWVEEMCAIVGLSRSQLPVLWDADFLYGPRDADGADTYVLCEINVSSVYPFPPDAMASLVADVIARLDRA
ncbi:MAG: Cj0069 family protein, partial [Alphaproteobacteria bacterium]|nr:Cj0069 family protein [Alphaproteobacteria bacterium]